MMAGLLSYLKGRDKRIIIQGQLQVKMSKTLSQKHGHGGAYGVYVV
jgi:hypothetical protein